MSSRSRNRALARQDQQQRGSAQFTATVQTKVVRAFPPPDDLERYEVLYPGFTERLLDNWDAQGNHRMALETKVIGGDIRRSDVGLILGFVLSIFTIGCGTYLIAIGRDIAGLVTLVTAAVGLVATLVYATVQRNKRRER